MPDYFEERKRESQEDFYEAKKRDTAYWQKRKEEKDIADKKRYIELKQKYSWKNVKKMPMPKVAKPVRKPKPKLTVAQKAARSAKRKRTIKKVYRAVKTFIYGKPKPKRKTTTKRKSTKKK